MKPSALGYLPCALAAVAFVAFGLVLKLEMGNSRRLAEAWAARDLDARTELAAASIGDALATGDFNRLRAFADMRSRSNALRLTVLSAPAGGMIYDSEPAAAGNHAACPEVHGALAAGTGRAVRVSRLTGRKMLYCARKAGDDYIVRLALPYEVVVDPLRRNRLAMVLSGLVGASGLLLVLLFSVRLVARNRRLARERDAKARLLAEMRRVADFRRDFIANVSHEIKTPLTGILGAVDLLGGGDSLPEADRRSLLAMLRRESTRLDALARDILSLARLEREEEAPRRDFAPADLADVLATAADRVRPRAEAAGMRLVVAPAPALVLPCDARLVEQALVNLALNAVLHSGSPDVVLSLAPTATGAAFTVADHGVGLHEADRARVFERFYRVDKARSRDAGGTGLGLAIVKHVAQLHGGDASVASEPGRGCAFTFTLNTKEPEQPQHAQKGKNT